jgi:hypothetical protein
MPLRVVEYLVPLHVVVYRVPLQDIEHVFCVD